jgi:hypothetical protein
VLSVHFIVALHSALTPGNIVLDSPDKNSELSSKNSTIELILPGVSPVANSTSNNLSQSLVLIGYVLTLRGVRIL